ncbi:hypothetical protein I3843_01G006900 [Carya illinoinensis]|uniref:Uncharacterized protein n=1 Tax=Carya illinoinensis TaxID=32201 RepID=A0A8T1RGY5_CARIL|nr:uncharacterized protein LOC122304636 [Carya illinoinensis]XP_042972835.1 uncharacterized protein LOC122304636 [Carya illinoinensis]KAG2724200.1 hypothetical protein I3760_01G006700 [Carya illinoinensis]KAG2724201.1 hypothetical protein I3760_01G006700 [Carya illinoinensis]KAG6666095.1 hypothetical protein CIPAW_01G006700 [Carya illinoinensis]KAG6666096.1 hypothetical protein CIPAW_01G006700 [Carya illinoinensis]KAG6729011.1 hypothetical protein I3842_01G006200 [Carya illinoinensis]
MDQKLLNPYDRECMRLAMIKHEETFKEQVSELHRLYRIQKMLMRDIRSNRPKIARSQERLWNLKNELGFIQNSNYHQRDAEPDKPQRKLDLEQPAEHYIAEPDDGEGVLELIEESEIELTLGPSNYNRWKKPETPLTSDSGPSFSSSSTGSSQINRTSSWIHQITRDQLTGYELGLVKVPDMTSGYHSRSKNNIDVEEQQLRQERLNQAPWLFQVLSLNMT